MPKPQTTQALATALKDDLLLKNYSLSYWQSKKHDGELHPRQLPVYMEALATFNASTTGEEGVAKPDTFDVSERQRLEAEQKRLCFKVNVSVAEFKKSIKPFIENSPLGERDKWALVQKFNLFYSTSSKDVVQQWLKDNYKKLAKIDNDVFFFMASFVQSNDLKQSMLEHCLFKGSLHRFIGLLALGFPAKLSLLESSFNQNDPRFKQSLLNEDLFKQCRYDKERFYDRIVWAYNFDAHVFHHRRRNEDKWQFFTRPNSPKYSIEGMAITGGIVGGLLGLVATGLSLAGVIQSPILPKEFFPWLSPFFKSSSASATAGSSQKVTSSASSSRYCDPSDPYGHCHTSDDGDALIALIILGLIVAVIVAIAVLLLALIPLVGPSLLAAGVGAATFVAAGFLIDRACAGLFWLGSFITCSDGLSSLSPLKEAFDGHDEKSVSSEEGQYSQEGQVGFPIKPSAPKLGEDSDGEEDWGPGWGSTDEGHTTTSLSY